MSITPHFSSAPQTQETTNLLSISVELALLNLSDEWNYTICGLWFIHVIACISTPFLFYQIIFGCLDIPHFIYPFISWRAFALFSPFPVISNASVNIHVQAFIALGYKLGMELLGHTVTWYLTSWGTHGLNYYTGYFTQQIWSHNCL